MRLVNDQENLQNRVDNTQRLKSRLKEKRPIMVSIVGYWLIIQGVIVFGNKQQLGDLSIVFTVLFIVLGIGLLRAYKVAYITTIFVFTSLFLWGLILLIRIGDISQASPASGVMIFSLIMVLFLITKSFRNYFSDNIKQTDAGATR